MKFFAVFSAIVAVAVASPASWTIHELSEALQNPHTDAALVPYLEQALNELMFATISGSPMPVTTVSSPVQDFSSWTLYELSEAIQDPTTSPALMPYLEWALNTMMSNIMAGDEQHSIIIGTPIGLLPIDVITPTPVGIPAVPIETPAVPIETPVVPTETPVVPAQTSSSPLVQIIVNVKSQQAAPIAVPVDVPEVADVIPSPVVLPEPVFPEVVIPSPVVLPPPTLPQVIPEPVIVSPVFVPNPDFIAVNPGVSVNPVDILSPVPVVAPVGGLDVVGPIV